MRSKNIEIKKAIEAYVDKFYDCSFRTPNLREIAENIGVSKPTVMRYLKEMADEGSIQYDSKNIITAYMRNRLAKSTVQIPLSGTVPCGPPTLEFEQKGEYIEIPCSFIGDGKFFGLIASGDSMIGAGIDDGDLIIVRQTNTAHYGQVVVALDENKESTLKRFCVTEDGIPYLHPENSKYDNIFPSELTIQGVAVKVIKDLE